MLFEIFRVGAMKTGLLCSAEIISAVAQAIQDGIENGATDPARDRSGNDCDQWRPLLEPAAIEAYKNELFPLATLITPNLDEAGLLLETTIKDRKAMENAAKSLANKYCASILLKGGHLRGDKAIDLLFHNGKLTEFSAPFTRGVETHGTGCTYSAAITAGLASGLSMEQAIKRAKKFVTESINRHFHWTTKTGEVLDALRHSS